MKKQNGFTLVELLVVIAIIALLTAIMTANFTSAKARSRDSRRISDLAQLQLALAGFFDRCNVYPDTLDISANCTTAAGVVTLGGFIGKIPLPPVGGNVTAASYDYSVVSESGNASNRFDYVLHTSLEVPEPSATQGALVSYPPTSWVGSTYASSPAWSCSDAASSLHYCVGPK